ncbi:MAG TPA: MFS transporter [Chloroflexota bacterium]|nr:MFS transporter [Chloroflexota bacterium]
MITLQPRLPAVHLGLRENWRQFGLLVLINAFVGAMVGLERAVLPLLAEDEFGVASRTAILSFVATFGAVKALANLFAGRLSDRVGRRGVLIAGWIVGLPVPFMVMFAPAWEWIVAANLLLGANQGLCWSTTVIMKIDLVGPARRGLAMGLNESAGYGAVALASLVSGYIAGSYGLRPEPFYLGVAFVLAGLFLTVFFAQETLGHVRHEASQHNGDTTPAMPSFGEVFRLTSWQNRNLFAVSQAGLVNNLNDGLAWGLLPLIFAAQGLSIGRIGVLAAIYPGVWALVQLGSGLASDRVGRKGLIVSGMLIQGLAIALMVAGSGFWLWAASAALLGIGTGFVYPTLLAAIGDVAAPQWRASAVGVYRLWRDTGYVVGALLAGILADLLGMSWAISTVAALTLLSGAIAARTMTETLAARRESMDGTALSKPRPSLLE